MPPVLYLVSAHLPAEPKRCGCSVAGVLVFISQLWGAAVSGSVLVMGLRDWLCSSHPPILREDKVAC